MKTTLQARLVYSYNMIIDRLSTADPGKHGWCGRDATVRSSIAVVLSDVTNHLLPFFALTAQQIL